MTAYRILLIGGPEDGDAIIAYNPWYRTISDAGNIYVAERDEKGQPIMEDGDQGPGEIEAITAEGSYKPVVKTIKMTYFGKESEEEREAWAKRKKEILDDY